MPLRIFSQINFVIHAAIKANIVYTIANIKKLASKNIKVTIRYIAKAVIATSIGDFTIFCHTMASSMVAIGNAKNNSNKFIYLYPLNDCFYII